MRRSTRLLLLLAVTLPATVAWSQRSERLTASVRGSFLVPAGGLADLFRSGPGAAVTFGERSSADMLWEGVLEGARFTRGNTDALTYDALSLKLEWVGAGVQMIYFPLSAEGMLDGALYPFVSGSAVMTRWKYERGPMATDSAGTAVIASFKQQDWSLALSAGGGFEAYPLESVSIYAQASYKLVIGEIWPTLALRLDGASGFPMLDVGIGVRFWF